ncbi:MAG: heavy metal translocating P-type ATPase, partial [Enterococcus sp.]|nr:heavy metal translocating P-type ATPase [Enterococcus sp.]
KWKKTRSAIKELTQMAPVTAWKIEDEAIEEIDVDEVEIDDVLLVKTGDQVPVDGIVIEGESYINEASITGESVPKKKQPGDVVYAGTLVDSGTIKMKATKVGEDTTFAKIIALVEQAQDSKSPAERFIDKFARYYTPCVVLIAALVFLFLRNLDTAITVLVLACPGALVIGAPIANVAGIGRGAKEGILLKGGDSIHTFAKSDVFAFDKTGSLTIGHPVVEQCLCLNDPSKLISYACALEQASSHPLAKSILDYASQKEIAIHPIELVETIKGKGLKGTIDNHPVLIGSLRFLKENNIAISNEFQTLLDNHKDPSASYVYMSVDENLELTFLIKDSIKEDAKDCLVKLKKLGIKECVMLTGDNEVVAKSVASQIGIDTTYHELLPEDKLSIINNLRSQNHIVTFVGDGINDSPALMGSDIGIAMGSGTDVAIESSDVVLIKSNLESITKALMISK